MDIDPSRLEAAWSDGRASLQPRSMQVLIVLARAAGAVVTRDTLAATCWGGRAVGDDVINRVIHLLRALADRAGAHGFTIHTIAKVGYRLVAAEPAADAPVETRLAVLAFDNLTGDPDLGYFADGVTEEILHTVAKTTTLKVVGRSSSFSLRGADKSADRAAVLLGATHVLDGSVRRADGRLRITAQLEVCATRTPLWSDRFERSLADVFAVQDEIAAAVAAALNVAFAPSPDLGPIDPEAYDLYLRARSPGEEWLMPDATLLEKAVARAPRFAAAWALLALTRAATLRWGYGRGEFAEQRAAIVTSVETALALDPGAALAHLAMGTFLPICGHFVENRRMTLKALAAAPHDSLVLAYACGHYDVIGRQRAAFAYAARAYELDPRSIGWYYAYMLEALGRRSEADETYDRDMLRWGPLVAVAANALRSAFERGDWERYDGLRARAHPTVLNHPLAYLVHASAERLRNWSDAVATAALDEVRRNVRETGTTGLTLPATLCSRGRADEVYRILEEASFAHLFEPEGALPPGEFGLNVLFTPLSRAMRRDPRFVQLCAKLGLCDFWIATDEWPDCTDEVAPFYDLRSDARALVRG
jgi:TolB-like protein